LKSERGKGGENAGGRRAAVIYLGGASSPLGTLYRPRLQSEHTINTQDSHHSRYIEITVKRKRWKSAEVVEGKKVER
jgi:hypothetical protein